MPVRSFTSAPAENSLPAAVRIAARTSSRALISSNTRISSSRACLFCALTGGRSIVTVARWSATSTRTVSKFIRPSGQDQRIDCDATLGQCNEWIDFCAGHFGMRGGEARHRDQRIAERIEVGRRLAARTGEQREALDAVDHLERGRVVDRREAQGDILEHLDIDAT